MDVSITTLRAQLKDCLARAREGEEVVITDRGTPVARIVRVSTAALLDELEADGLLARPTAAERLRAATLPRVRARSSVAARVSDQRD